MGNTVSRRDFLLAGAAASSLAAAEWTLEPGLSAGLLGSGTEKAPAVADQVPWKARAFPMTEVRLEDELFKPAMETNRRYLHLLENDRLLYSFRQTAGFSTTALPYGGWEAPDCELRGHYNGGHYLSACALTYSSTGDEDLKKKADALVSELALCQSKLSGGYLGAYPATFYDRLRDGKRVWAPFYTYHKIMAGHLDMYEHCGNEQALQTAEKMADWTGAFVDPLTDEHMQHVLRVEHGGMMEVLLNLYAVTGKDRYYKWSQRFDHKAILDPLAARQDELNGKHANTNIPKIIGCARAYELTKQDRFFNISDYFWTEITTQRAYCTGGTSGNREEWHEAGQISQQLWPAAQECCCSYNLMKLTRHLYGQSLDPAKIDYYERLLYNVRLGTQDPDGMVMYFVSTAPGQYRTFGTPYDSFLCCGGTGIEEFSKTQDTIYFHDDRGIYVNLFIASEVNWPEKGVKLTQRTRFPEEERTSFVISTSKPVNMALQIRIPYWAEKGAVIKVNGERLNIAAAPKTYAKIERRWANGDRVEVTLPMRLRMEPTPDDPTVQAVLFGPMVLAGNMGNAGLNDAKIYGPQGPEELKKGQKPAPPPEIKSSSKDSAGWMEPVSGKTREFQTVGQSQNYKLVPFYKIFKDRYTVYWKVEA